jgi:hypothetical protein
MMRLENDDKLRDKLLIAVSYQKGKFDCENTLPNFFDRVLKKLFMEYK